MADWRRSLYSGECSVFTCRKPFTEQGGYYDHDNRRDKRCPDCYAKMMREEAQTQVQALKQEYDYANDGPAPMATTTKLEPYSPEQLAAAVERIVQRTGEHYLQTVPALVSQELARLNRTLEIKVGKAPKVTIKVSHKALPTVLQMVVAGVSPFLVGPAGSGKTTLAEQVATALGRKFYMAARVTSEFKLVGFANAQGQTVRTQFREAYEHGGVFLFDEVDASDPDALTAFNAALANGLGDFPDGMIKRHPDFVAIAAGNTYGRGADRQYVGRNQLDAATLDRFVVLDVDYDEQLELELAGNAEWVGYVQSIRRAINDEKVRHIVSPRASIYGAKLLAQGLERSVVEDATIWKGLPEEARSRVESRARQYGNRFETKVA